MGLTARQIGSTAERLGHEGPQRRQSRRKFFARSLAGAGMIGGSVISMAPDSLRCLACGVDRRSAGRARARDAGYSRWISALLLPSRQAPDLLAGHWQLLGRLGAVPRALVWDNEAAAGSWRAGRPKLTEDFEAFRGTLGIRVIQCRPRDPEAKGLVERANGYLETSFLPGRSFTDPADFNAQLDRWLTRANARQHRALGCRPLDRLEADRAAMLALPPVAPQTG